MRYALSQALSGTSGARVLIVDDSAVIRAVLTQMIRDDGRFTVAAALPTAAAALTFLATDRVDIILLDLEMPGMDGLTALPTLLATGRGARILIVSSICDDGAFATVRALSLGAADTLTKPVMATSGTEFRTALITKLARLAEATSTAHAPVPAASVASGDPFDIVAIGASTGGIHAIGAMLREIPRAMTTPILVTQHLPVAFSSYFAAQLAALADRPCEVATDAMRIMPGRVVIAPGDAHIQCVPIGSGAGALRLDRRAVANGCMPSVDPMFASVAAVHGRRALAILLSGMGRDGCEGARVIRDAGGGVVVQDQASSVVWGMPGAAFGAGLADAVLAPAAIGRLVASGCKPL